MCGVAGVFGAQSINIEDVKKMALTIEYRGVDEIGIKQVSDNIIMAHARLAVVDVENGKQPMSNEDDTVWVIFNGEIYNSVELREELIKKGHHFKSRCDTEVLVHLWEEDGEKLLNRLIGMFTFFIWDTNLNRGMLARDRQGIKPCFIAPYKNGIAFCSEIKGILSLPDFPKKMNMNNIRNVFCFNYALPPETCFENIQHLEPGHYLFFEKGKSPIKKKYWEWPFYEEKKTPHFDDFEALLNDAIFLQMRFDVAGGMFFSGGVDSSVVASHLVKQWTNNKLTKKLEGLSLHFSEEQYSEFPLALESAQYLGLKTNPVDICAQNIPEIAEKVSYFAEQPHGDFSFFLFYLLSQKAHNEGNIVMFNGDGPDEALSGYRHTKLLFEGVDSQNNFEKGYFHKISYMNDDDLSNLLMPDFIKNTDHSYDCFQHKISSWKDLSPMEQMAAYECNMLLPGNNLAKTDKMGACWSIEGRSPFLDHRISELFIRLPAHKKFKEGVGKLYLKEYALRQFPKSLIFRNKSMPTMPIGEWLKGPLYNWAYELLSNSHSGIIHSQNALKTLHDHKIGRANNTAQLRTLIMFSVWEKVYF